MVIKEEIEKYYEEKLKQTQGRQDAEKGHGKQLEVHYEERPPGDY